MFPRDALPRRSRPVRTGGRPGVYLLLGPRPIGEGDMHYVGEGDPSAPALKPVGYLAVRVPQIGASLETPQVIDLLEVTV